MYKRAQISFGIKVHDAIDKLTKSSFAFLFDAWYSYLNSQVSPASTNANNILRSIFTSHLYASTCSGQKFHNLERRTRFIGIEAIMPTRDAANALCFPFIPTQKASGPGHLHSSSGTLNSSGCSPSLLPFHGAPWSSVGKKKNLVGWLILTPVLADVS